MKYAEFDLARNMMQRNSVFEKRQNDTSQIKQENGLNVVHFTILWIIVIVIIISRAPSVSCATRLKLSICLFYFFYPGISSEPLNLSQQKFAR